MDAIKVNTVIRKDGEIKVSGMPFKKGQSVEMIILVEKPDNAEEKKYGTAGDLLKSEIVGMWKDREDITDSSSFALRLRQQAQNRNFDL